MRFKENRSGRKDRLIATLPHIRIQVKRAGTVRNSSLSLAALGLGLHLAWILCTSLGSLSIVPGASLPGFEALAGQGASPVFVAAMASQALVLLAAGAFSADDPGFFGGRPAAIAASVALAAGTAAVFVVDLSGISSGALPLLGAAVIGIACAVLLLFWGIAFSRMDLPSIVLNISCAMAVAVIIFCCLDNFVVGLHDSWTPGSWTLAVLPLLEAPCALLSGASRGASETPDAPAFPLRRGKFGTMLAVSMALFGIALGLLKIIATPGILSNGNDDFKVVALVLACLCVPVLLLLPLPRGEKRGSRWDLMLRPLLVVVAIAAFAGPLLLEGSPAPALFLLIACYLYVEAILWSLLAGPSREYRLPPVFLVGIGRGALSFGALCGILLAANTPLIDNLPAGVAGGAVVCIFAIGYVLNPRIDIARRDALASQATDGAPSGKDAVSTGTASASATLMGAAGLPGAPSTAASGGSPGELPTSADGTTASAATPGIPSARTDADAYWRACESIARDNGLSSRQTEVLYLLARGHNAAYIHDKLRITLSTAKTHIYRIYKKLGVHNQQEILEIVEKVLAEKDARA